METASRRSIRLDWITSSSERGFHVDTDGFSDCLSVNAAVGGAVNGVGCCRERESANHKQVSKCNNKDSSQQ